MCLPMSRNLHAPVHLGPLCQTFSLLTSSLPRDLPCPVLTLFCIQLPACGPALNKQGCFNWGEVGPIDGLFLLLKIHHLFTFSLSWHDGAPAVSSPLGLQPAPLTEPVDECHGHLTVSWWHSLHLTIPRNQWKPLPTPLRPLHSPSATRLPHFYQSLPEILSTGLGMKMGVGWVTFLGHWWCMVHSVCSCILLCSSVCSCACVQVWILFLYSWIQVHMCACVFTHAFIYKQYRRVAGAGGVGRSRCPRPAACSMLDCPA